jgi:Staphylococcal nuclease homologue
MQHVPSQQDVATIRALGRQASDFTKHLVHVGERVRLEFDQQPRDKYQRLLAFVWLPDGRMLNETIICEGCFPAFTRYPFRQDYMDRFRACERSARQGNKGLWREERVATTVAPSARSSQTRGEIHGNRRSKIDHLPSCPNYSRLKPENVVPFASEADAVQTATAGRRIALSLDSRRGFSQSSRRGRNRARLCRSAVRARTRAPGRALEGQRENILSLVCDEKRMAGRLCRGSHNQISIVLSGGERDASR